MKKVLALCLFSMAAAALFAAAPVIYPVNNATVLAKSQFDLKIELPGIATEAQVKVSINGRPYQEILGQTGAMVADQYKSGGKDLVHSALLLRNASIAKPGIYKVVAEFKGEKAEVSWEVYAGKSAQAKNVIILVADGLSMGHRTAARILSKGMTEGKYNGKLAMDTLSNMGLVGTGSVDSIAADSANTASAYTTGQKSSVNALGVYADRTASSTDDPRQETIAEFLKRNTKKSVGVVSDAELVDATPASVVAHTRRRADKDLIAEQFLALQPEIMLGGGSGYFIAKGNGGKRADEKDIIGSFQKAGYAMATTATELAKVDSKASKVLGLFAPSNMDSWLDRNVFKTTKLTDQPDLTTMTSFAIDRLSKNKDGFFLMVEAGLVDKATHPLDWERAAYDTIMFDKAVQIALDFAAKDKNTLVIVTGDHTHAISVVGTVDDSIQADLMRDKVGVYDRAGYPNYVDANMDGYPDSPEVSKRLFVTIGNHPDYYETYRPKADGVFAPAVQGADKLYVANEKYNVPGAIKMVGNLPRTESTGVHTVDDMTIGAFGPGSDAFRGFMENTDVFKFYAQALGLGR